jgi:gamma-glutamyltranspeptidase / glutathione hydrolase
MRLLRKFFPVFFLLPLLSPTLLQAQTAASGVVVSDNKLATQAGMEVLKAGGNAVDAAVATAFALGVVDPASSGIGGGGFMVIYQGKERKAHALDFRETAPASARKDLFVKGGKVVPHLSLNSPLAVAVPGQVAGLTEALKRFGRLPLATVMAPAIRLAGDGFPLQGHLRHAIERQLQSIRKSSDLARIFLKGDEVPAEGDVIRQAELAAALKAISEKGAQVFYDGWIGQAIVERLKKEGGILTLEDLRGYKAVWREPIIGNYRRWVVITVPPPSSGGIALIQMLNMLDGYQLGLIPQNSTTYLHLVAEAMKQAFADRARYLGDPDFVQVPTAKLISKEYAEWTRSRFSPLRTHEPKFYGQGASKSEEGGTTHFGVLDQFGNAVSSTLTVNTQFGSKILVPGTGIVLNNEMDDFSLQPGDPNVYGLIGNEANAIQPKKRPLSSMTPSIVLQAGRPVLIIGASGGPRIITATLQTILNVLDFHMPLKKAVEAARIHHQWIPDELAVESNVPDNLRHGLERRGHAVKERELLGAVQAIHVRRSKIFAEADARKNEWLKSEKPSK